MVLKEKRWLFLIGKGAKFRPLEKSRKSPDNYAQASLWVVFRNYNYKPEHSNPYTVNVLSFEHFSFYVLK